MTSPSPAVAAAFQQSEAKAATGAGPATPTWSVGTLTYTKAGLIGLFALLLWGDFCFTLHDIVVPSLLPLKLKELGASNLTIGLLCGSLPGVLNTIITPIVSYQSDRHRGPLGRRIPYLLWPTPFVVLFLVLIGFAPQLGFAANARDWLGISRLSPQGAALLMLTVTVLGFQIFHMVVASIYYYLFADVVPQALMGRFMSLFRLFGAAATALYNLLIFGHAATHMTEIYVGVAALYLISFGLMVWGVREGKYPPPEPQVGPVASTARYMRESFGSKFAWVLYGGIALMTMSLVVSQFFVFYAEENAKLSLNQWGKISGCVQLAGLIAVLPAGYLADKIHPLRLFVGACVLLLMVSVVLMLLRTPTYASLMAIFCVRGVATSAYLCAWMPMCTALLPRDRFGQFASAIALVNALCLIAANSLLGWVIDRTNDYAVLFVWATVLNAAALPFLIWVDYRRRAFGDTVGNTAPRELLVPLAVAGEAV